MGERSPRDFRTFLFGIFLISLVSLCYEVALSFEFAFMFWFYLSFIIIALAMFGIGVGSVIGYRLRRRYEERYFDILHYSALALGGSMVLSLALTGRLSQGGTYSGDTAGYVTTILVIMASSVVPFVFSGALLSVGLNYPAREKRYVSFIYFADLVGAGIGVFIITSLLPFSSVEEVMVLCGIAAVLASTLFLEEPTWPRMVGVLLILGVAGAVLLNVTAFTPGTIGGKFLSIAKDQGAETLETRWTSVSRIDVVEYPDSGMRRFVENGEYPITISRGYGANNQDPRRLMFTRDPETMLAIGAGGGVEVAMGLAEGVEEVTAVEINPFIIDYMTDEMGGYSHGLYRDPRVRVFPGDGRTFIQGSKERYDLIENGVIGSAGLVVPSTSMLTTKDVSVYTVEANQEYIRHLTENGVAVTIIYGLLDDFNAIDRERGVTSMVLKQYTTVKEALRKEGLDPNSHFMIFRLPGGASIINGNTAQSEYTFIFRSQLTPDEVDGMIKEADGYGLECLYAPYGRGLDLDGMISRLPVNKDVSPALDDRPFFYYTDRDVDLLFLAVIAFMFVLTLLFIILPIALDRRVDMDRSNVTMLIFFLSIGIGFILIETTLIQKLVLFLGRPSYAFQVVLFSMLIFSGLGSMTGGAIFKDEERVPGILTAVLGAIAALVLLYSWAIPAFIKGLIHLGLESKVPLTMGLLAPLSFLMGMPFPLGLRMVSRSKPRNVIWMYGVNSSGSVLASIIGMAVALSVGMTVALLLGGLMYGLGMAGIFMVRRWQGVSFPPPR